MKSLIFGFLLAWTTDGLAASTTGCGRLLSKVDQQGPALTGVAVCYDREQPVIAIINTQTVVVESVPGPAEIVRQVAIPTGVFVVWRYKMGACYYHRVGVMSATKTYIWGRSIPACKAAIETRLVGHRLIITIPADHTILTYQRTFGIDIETFKWDSF